MEHQSHSPDLATNYFSLFPKIILPYSDEDFSILNTSKNVTTALKTISQQ